MKKKLYFLGLNESDLNIFMTSILYNIVSYFLIKKLMMNKVNDIFLINNVRKIIIIKILINI